MKRIVGFIPEKKTAGAKRSDRKAPEKAAEKAPEKEAEKRGKSP